MVTGAVSEGKRRWAVGVGVATRWVAVDEASSDARPPRWGRPHLGVPVCRLAVPAMLRRRLDVPLAIITVVASSLEATVRVPPVATWAGWPAIANAALDYRREPSCSSRETRLLRLATAVRATTAGVGAAMAALHAVVGCILGGQRGGGAMAARDREKGNRA
ncbi:hypothetical protein MMPV_002740 [Pyropia vietnamensis]